MKWRHFAERTLPVVIRELGIPCVEPALATGMTRCPRHRVALGQRSRVCPECHSQAWDEVGRRYASAEQAQLRPGNPTEDDPPLTVSTFPGPRYEPTPGQLDLFENEHTNTKEEDPMQQQPQSAELVPIEGELVPDEPSTEIALRSQALFGTDPELALRRQVELSKLVVGPVEQQRLFVNIRGRKYVKVEGWELVGAMKSVFASIAWTRPNENGDGYVARAEARWLDDRFADGRLVGAGEAECSRQEPKWRDREPFAIRAMAQTRAISRALRGPLGPVFVLADYEMVGAEEMPVVEGTATPGEKDEPAGPLPQQAQPTVEQKRELIELVAQLQTFDPNVDWPARCRELAGVSGNKLTLGGAGYLIDKLKAELARLHEEDAA
jgi:hypothetical protein